MLVLSSILVSLIAALWTLLCALAEAMSDNPLVHSPWWSVVVVWFLAGVMWAATIWWKL